MNTQDLITGLLRRIERLEKSPLAHAANDADYAVAMAVEMGFDESILERSKVPEVLTARQRLAMRLRTEKHWSWSRIAAVLQCTEASVMAWQRTFRGNLTQESPPKAQKG